MLGNRARKRAMQIRPEICISTVSKHKVLLMRLILLTLLLPLLGLGQTVPEEKGKIVYEDEVNMPQTSKEVLFDRARAALQALQKYAHPSIDATDAEHAKVEARGRIRMTRHQKDNYAVSYHLQLQVKDNKYKYRIDDLKLLHFKRHKTKEKDAEDLFGDINNSDKVAVESEQELNSMDMDILKFIDLLNNEMRKG